MRVHVVAATLALAFGRASPPHQPATPAIECPAASILVYHRFGQTVADTMTVRTSTFRWQLDYLRRHGRAVVPLRSLIACLQGRGPAPPAGSVVITADDGHRSVFAEMLPAVRDYGIPVTLFIYPSAISNAAYAMTWDQLAALHRTGFFDIQSHTYWHPNFKNERRRLAPAAYRTFATTQFAKSKRVLEDKLGIEVDLLAWPFGIYDDELIEIAGRAGYVAGFTLDRRPVTAREPVMALPRFLVTDRATGGGFTSMLPPDQP